MSSPLGIFGSLPADLLSAVCRHLPMSDVINVSKLDDHLGRLVERGIYREIKGIKVDVYEEENTIHFIHKDGRVTHLNLNQVDWEDVVKYGKCIESLELNICPDKSISQLFKTFERKCGFSLLSIKINVFNGSDTRCKTVHNRCIDLVFHHRKTLRHIDVTTSDEQNVYVTVNRIKSTMQLTYNQSAEPKPSEQAKHSANHNFVYTLFHTFIEGQDMKNLTLEIASKYDANLALQKAGQIAMPYSKRRILETLTIEFGNSLKEMSEEEMKTVLLRHVDEFHFSTPNLQHFHCNLPHEEIDLSQDFLSMLSEPVRKSRKSPTSRPYNSTFSLRQVRCK